MSHWLGKTVLHYRILDRIGQGGMGVVYRALDTRLDRTVALKCLPHDVSADESGRQRFVIEAKAAAALSHPNIATIHAIEECDGELFIVMEYIDGKELRMIVGSKPMEVGYAIQLAAQIAEGLHAAHAGGIVHRDIKSSNVMVTESGQVKVMDFGLARMGSMDRITRIGSTIGTIAYMSPEQARGEELDRRTDIWSFGVVLYEMLTGRLPFRGDYDQALIYMILNEDPVPVTEVNPRLPGRLGSIVKKALQKNREARYRDLSEVIDELGGLVAQPTITVGAETRNAFVLRGELRAFAILMGDTSEAIIHQSLERVGNLIALNVKEFGGRLTRSPGHTIIASFDDAPGCVSCTRATLEKIASLNSKLPAAERMHYRFGLDYGEMSDGADGPEGVAVARAGERACFAPTDDFRMTESFVESIRPADLSYLLESRSDQESSQSQSIPKQLDALDVPPPSDRPSVAIMPFAAGNDVDSEAIAEGLRIDITNALMKVKDIFLIAPSAMNRFRGAPGDEAASRMGTRHLLEGSVRRSGQKIRVAMRLTDTTTGSLVWSETYDRLLDDTFKLQDEIAERVITELDVNLTIGEQARVWHKCLLHPKARESFYLGLNAFFASTAESVLTAQKYFERVAKLVPDSPVGATWAALSYWLQSTHGWTDSQEETRTLACSWAERAAAMEDADGQAHTVLGAVLLFQHRYDEALSIARDSVFIRPGCNTANGILASVLLHCGNYDEAIVHARRAIRIGPVYPPSFLEILSAAYREAGKVDFAAAVAREIIRLVPETVHGRLLLTSALVRGGWPAEARRVVAKILTIDSTFSADRFLEAQPFRSEEVCDRLREEFLSAGVPR